MKALGCLVGNASEIVPGVSTGSSRQNVFLDIEKLTLRNGSGLEGRAEPVHIREKNGIPARSAESPGNGDREGREATAGGLLHTELG